MHSFDTPPFTVLEAKPRVSGCRLGTIVKLRSGPLVDFPGNPFGPQLSRVIASLSAETISAAYEAKLPVLLVFENDDPARPVIIDVVIDHPDRVEPDEMLSPRSDASPLVESGRSEPGQVEVRLGRIVGLKSRVVLVELDSEFHTPLEATSTITLRNLKDPVVLLVLDDGSAVIVGQVYDTVLVQPVGGEGAEVVLKGSRVTIEADLELVLKSGACLLRLDSRGKVSTTADHIVSRARTTNKVQGGSVQLN